MTVLIVITIELLSLHQEGFELDSDERKGEQEKFQGLHSSSRQNPMDNADALHDKTAGLEWSGSVSDYFCRCNCKSRHVGNGLLSAGDIAAGQACPPTI
eukprot:941483-Rhodomonas_salina.1